MRILLCGLCPLPFENERKSYAPGVRTWMFALPLRDAGHEVRIFARRIPFVYPPETPAISHFERDGIEITSVEWSAGEDFVHLRRILEEFSPDAVVGANVYGSYDACRLDLTVPIWADMNGHVMAEAQAKAFIASDNRYLSHFWGMVRTIMPRGDVFSSVSNHQRFAMIGELGAFGRLTSETVGYEFVHMIENGMDPEPLEHRNTVLRGSKVPGNAFVVLWSGGYNVWVDVDTLFAGLELAMAQDPTIYFVSTGGMIDGHDESTYPYFQELIEGSPHRDRYVLLGWRPKEEVTDYYFEADIGISIDRYMYEGLLGSKNRILDWFRAGLPTLAGELSEITTVLREKGIGFTYPLGDPEALGRSLVELASDRDRVQEVGRRAREYAKECLTFHATVRPLVHWASAPRHAPDFETQRIFSGCSDLDSGQKSAPLSVRSRTFARMKPLLDRLGLTRWRLGRPRAAPEGESKRSLPGVPAQTQREGRAGSVAGSPARDTQASASPAVIIVTYNSALYIESCLDSLADCGGQPQIIVVDNASADGTADAVARYPTVKLIQNQKNLGFAAAVNRGAQATQGDPLILLNPDTLVFPGYLERLLSSLRDPSIGVAGCKILEPDGVTLQHAGGVVAANALTQHVGRGEEDRGQYDELAEVDYVTGAGLAIRREVWESLGGFDEGYWPAYFEETELCWQARARGYRVVFVPEAVLLH